MKNYRSIAFGCVFLIVLSAFIRCRPTVKEVSAENQLRDSTIIDREYALEASMLGYFAPDGTRNPILRANIGDRVRITITNGETMTHDIAMEKLGIKAVHCSKREQRPVSHFGRKTTIPIIVRCRVIGLQAW